MANTTVVGTLRALLVAETSQFDAALKKSTTTAQAWAKDLAAIGTSAASVGQTLADKLTAPLASLGTTAASVTTAFETSFGGMRGAIASSQADVQKLGDAFKGVASVAPVMAGPVKTTTEAVDGLGKAGTRAYDVFHGLGADAPQQINKVGTAAKQATNDVGGIAGSFKGVAATVGVGFAVTQVIDFGKAIVDDAAHIGDLSSKLGISAEAVQRFGYAASQSGASMDTIGSAIGKMNVTLAEGDKSTVAVLDQIGLSFRDIRAMKPEDAFSSIAEAIQRIPDPMLQAEAATKLFGKTGMELLPAINANLIEIGNSAKVMGDHTVEELSKAQQEWEAFVNNIKVSTAEFMVWSKENAPKYAFGVAGLVAQGAASLVKSTYEIVYGQKAVIADAAASLTTALGTVKDPMAGLGLTAKSTAGLLGDFSVAQDQAAKHAADLEAAQTKAAAAAEAHRQKIADLAATLSGVGIAQKVKDLDEATQLAIKTWGIGVLNSKELVTQVQALGQAGAALTPVLMDVYRQHVQLTLGITTTADAMTLLKVTGGDVAPMLRDQAAAAAELAARYRDVAKGTSGDANKLLSSMSGLNVKLAPPPKATASWGATLGQGLAADVPASMIKAFQGGGNVGKSVGATIGSTVGSSVGPAIGKAATKAVSGIVGKGLGAAIGGLAGNAIPIVGPIIGQMVGGLIDKAFSHKGRDAAVGFADSMGGFDELHKKLGTLGAAGETMWGQLTHVGKKDEKGANKIIENIQKAFEDAEKKAAELQARLEKVKGKMGELGDKLQDFGGVVPASMRPMIENLLKSTDLTEDMKKALGSFAKDPSWQTLEKKATDLGINLKGMGKQFQQAKLGDIAFGYVHDLQMFSDSGADMQIVIEGMSDELSTLYATAQSTGAKLPNTLKPYMQTLVDQGLLLDETGQKVDHLNEDSFADIEDKGLKDVVTVLEAIRDLLKDSLPKAADQGAKDIQANFDRAHLRLPVDLEYGPTTPPGWTPPPGAPGSPGGPEDPGTGGPGLPPRGPIRQPAPGIGMYGGTHGAFVDWGSGTNVTLHGREAVVPEGQTLGGGPGPILITVVSQLDGKEVARNQIRYIPNELRHAGV